MLTAVNNKKQKVIGWEAKKGDTYYCPSCEEELILRQGEIKVHHFAHVAETQCQYKVGETEEHLWMKKNLYQKFVNSHLYKDVELEYKTGNRIADIYLVKGRSFGSPLARGTSATPRASTVSEATPVCAEIALNSVEGCKKPVSPGMPGALAAVNGNDKKIAVECQLYNLDIAEFRRKTAYYSYQGIYTLWIFSGNNELEKRLIKLVHTRGSRLNYTSTEVDLKCHRWYYGRFYYFYNDNIYAIHFHPIESWVPSSCDECIEQSQCSYRDPTQCPKYRAGYFRKPQALREISIYPVNNMRLVCVDRKDRLRIAKFNEPTWWKV